MAKNNVEKYIDELKNASSKEKEADLYSLKKELLKLDNASKIFDDFEKKAAYIDKNTLEQIQDFSSLIKLRSLASELKNKKEINGKLHSLHFSLNLLKNGSMASDISAIKNVLGIFLYNDETKIDGIINELNDFKIKIDEIKKHYSNLLPKSLDNKLNAENRYDKHIEQLHLIRNKQKDALISTINIFLKSAKKRMKNLKRFK